ncbi:MAG: hypothetical protein IPO21_01965 [Bacteroidales bacterium]|nr:hypothetical protein [Bacteroidales bacterium]
MKNFLCPVCNSNVIETQYFNNVYKDNNYYCESCNSYHVFKKIDDSAYYKENYHEKFNYKLSSFKYKLISLLPFIAYRSTSRLVYLKSKLKKIKFKNILEIGAGAGEHFIVFNNYFKLEKYIMVEPGVVIGFKNEKLKVIDSVFEATDISDYKDVELIMMFHVLEHIFDLDDFFEKIKKTGAKYFYFEVPNIANEQCKNLSLLDHPTIIISL